MRRNKIIIEQEILGSLIFNGPLKLTNIACVVRTNCDKMKKILEELNQQGLITKKSMSQDELFLITTKGLNFYRKIGNQILII